MTTITQAAWVLTSYYNPMRYRRRLENYHAFRHHLRAPLATIELSFDGGFELRDGDADLLVRLHGGDIMWQKERLLNLLVARLPAACRYVAWLDADLVFERADWLDQAVHALQCARLVQPFTRLYQLPPGVAGRDASPSVASRCASSVAACLDGGWSATRALHDATNLSADAPSPGKAWVSRRELIAQHGLFDACIIGGGDTAFACAALGAFDEVVRLHAMNDHQVAHYLRWAKPVHAAVGGSLRALDGNVFHLWHGELSDRRAAERHQGLKPFDFDPKRDLKLAETGCWAWATEQLAMRKYVASYFAGRREDGVDSHVEARGSGDVSWAAGLASSDSMPEVR